jgi:hypothetical protein
MQQKKVEALSSMTEYIKTSSLLKIAGDSRKTLLNIIFPHSFKFLKG